MVTWDVFEWFWVAGGGVTWSQVVFSGGGGGNQCDMYMVGLGTTVVLTYIGSITRFFNMGDTTQLPNRMRSSIHLWKAKRT